MRLFRSFKIFILLSICLIINLTSDIMAKTLTVDDNLPADFSSVQSAIEAASTGDTIIVYDGEYNESTDIDFKGKDLIVTSANGPANCIIRDTNSGSTVWFHQGQSSNSILEGFTIEADLDDGGVGGGIAIESGTPTISNCIIKGAGTQNGDRGGGIYINGASPKILGCIIENCQVDDGADIGEFNAGAAIYIENTIGTAEIKNCLIRNNRIWFYDTGGNEEGGIIYVHSEGSSNVKISNCTIVNNSINDGNRGIIQCDGGSTDIINSIIWNNSGQSSSVSGASSVTYSCIQGGHSGEGNINTDPMFASDGYHLASGSPCIDTGTLTTSTDIDGDSRPYSFLTNLGDIGADEFTFCNEPTLTLNVNTNRTDSLSDSNSINFYEINLNSQSGYLKIYSTGTTDTIGYLIDDNTCGSSSWIKRDDNSGDGNNFYIEYPYAHPDNKLYFAVKKEGNSEESYTIYAEMLTDDQGNTCENAVNTNKNFANTYFFTSEILNIPQSDSASIDFIGDEDTYMFSTSLPGAIVVMSSTPGITAVLKDSDCNTITFPESLANNNFILKHENYNPDNNTFYLQLFSQSNNTILNYDVDVYYFPHDKRVDSFYKATPQKNWSGIPVGGSGSNNIDPDDGTYGITAKGIDIWDKFDEFYYLNKSVSGDCEITAKVESLNATNDWAKAGVMLRNSLNSDSRHTFSFMANTQGYNFHKRGSDGEVTEGTANQAASITIPQYIKLKKEDNDFFGYYSANGINWTPAANSFSLSNPLKKSFYAGIAVTSHEEHQDCSAVFKEVTIDSRDIIINDSSPETGHITIPGDIDFFEINNETYGTITIETANSGSQTYITLYDQSGTEITDRTNETFSSNNYSFSQNLGKGVHYIAVKSFDDQNFGFEYEIKADRTDLNDDHGNEFQTATWLKKWFGSSPLTYYDYENVCPEYTGDADVFRLDVEYQGYLTIMAEKISQDLNDIIYAELFNSEGLSIKPPADIRIATSPAAPPSNAYEIQINPGTYYIKLTGGTLGETYSLAVDFDDFGDNGNNNPRSFTEFEYPIIKGRIETTALGQWSGEDADAFEVKIPADNMRIKVYSTGDSNTYGVLKDYDGLGVNFNGGPGFDPNYDSRGNFMYTYPPENSDPSVYPPLLAGNSYYIEVSMENWEDTGEYNLHMELIDTEGNTCSSSNLILPGEPARYFSETPPGPTVENKVLSGLADVDMYKFVADKTGIAEIWTTGNTDTRGELKNSDCAVIAFNDDDKSYKNNKNFKIIYPVAKDETYFIAVKHYRIYETGVYSLNFKINEDSELVGDEGNSMQNAFSIGEVTAIQSKASTGHKLHYGNDVDCFMITTPDSGILKITTSGDEDTFTILKTGNGEILGFDDDTGEQYNSLIQTPVPSSGNYYLLIKSFDGNPVGTNYDINIEFKTNEDSCPGSITTANTAPVATINTDINEAIDYNGDTDFFKIEITTAGDYILRTTGNIDTHGILYNDSKDMVAMSDNGIQGDSQNFRITKNLNSGTYYLEVFANTNEDTGQYTLRFEQ